MAISGRRPLVIVRSIDPDGATAVEPADAAGPPAAPGWAARPGRGADPAPGEPSRLGDPTDAPGAADPAAQHPEAGTVAGASRARPGRTRRPTDGRLAAGAGGTAGGRG